MRFKNTHEFAVLDDPFLDLFGGLPDEFLAFGQGRISASQTWSLIQDYAAARFGGVAGPEHSPGAPEIQGPDVIVAPVEPVLPVGSSIQGPDVVVVPPVEPTVERPSVQRLGFLEVLDAPSLSDRLFTQHNTTDLITSVFVPRDIAAEPPIQDPGGVVVIPPPNPPPGPGPFVQDPNGTIVPPPPDPPMDHPTVQGSAFLPIMPPTPELPAFWTHGGSDGAALSDEAATLPIAAADWWFGS